MGGGSFPLSPPSGGATDDDNESLRAFSIKFELLNLLVCLDIVNVCS